MSDGVFGTAIDKHTLEGMPEYRGKQITRADIAKVARDLQTAGGKDTNCRRYVEDLKSNYGDGVSTLCTIYNATGDDLNYVLAHDYHGNISSSPYPIVIKNGQWGGWLHVHPTAQMAGSSAAVVYRGFSYYGVEMDWLLSWSNPWANYFTGSNRVYPEIRAKWHYEIEDNWAYLKDLVNNSGMSRNAKNDGCTAVTVIGTGTTAYYSAILGISPDY